MTKMILTGMSIIFIGTLLSMAGQKESAIGLIPAFIVMLNKVFIPRIGEIMQIVISRDVNDIVRCASLRSAHPTGLLNRNTKFQTKIGFEETEFCFNRRYDNLAHF